MGELVEMAEGRARHDWDHTSFLAAATLNVWSKSPVEPAQLNLFTTSGRRKSEDDGKIRVKLETLEGAIKSTMIEPFRKK